MHKTILQMPDNFKKIDHLFLNDGYNLAKSILQENTFPESLISLNQQLYSVSNQLFESFQNRVSKENKIIDCKKKCHWCCNQTVFTNLREAFFIKDFMQNNFSPSQRLRLRKKITEKLKNTSLLSLEEKLLYKETCPFLENQICIIYPARPMACRCYLSKSLTSCLNFYKNPADKNSYPQLYDFPLHAGRMLNEGIKLYLDGKDLCDPVLDLETAMDKVSQKGVTLKKWCNREIQFPQNNYSKEDEATISNWKLSQ